MPYNQALDEMQFADALLLFQASTCNRQIPANLVISAYSIKLAVTLKALANFSPGFALKPWGSKWWGDCSQP